MTEVEGETGHVSECADVLSLIRRPDGSAGILKQDEAIALFERHDLPHLVRHTKDLDQHHGLRLVPAKQVFEMIQVEAEGVLICFAHDRLEPKLDGRRNGGYPADTWHDDLLVAKLSRKQERVIHQ